MGAFVALIDDDPGCAKRALQGLAAAPHRGSPAAADTVGSTHLAVCRRPDDSTISLAVADGWAAVLHGRIDNDSELRAALADPARPAPGAGAAALTLAAFRTWGGAAVERLRGAFAGVVTDGMTTWAFRDHLGSRPLFLRRTSERLVFATEAKMVAAADDLSRRPDMDVVEELFYRGMDSHTAIAGVERLLGGRLATATRSNLTVERYWDPAPLLETSSLNVREATEQLTMLLEKTVIRHVTGQDAVALSGGLDSTTIAAFAAPAHLEMSGRPLSAYSAVFPAHPTTDESTYTAEVAAYLGIDVLMYEQQARPIDDLVDWVDLADGPWDSLPAPLASEGYDMARRLGASTVMTGDLAEYVMTIRAGFLGHLLVSGRLGALRQQVAARRREGRSRTALVRQLGRDLTPGALGARYTRLARRSSRLIPDWIRPEARGGSRLRTDLSSPLRERWSAPQLEPTGGASATMEADEIFADRLRVTVRRPFADRDLWEFLLSLRAEVKHPDPLPKSLLRNAMRGRLPEAILWRTDKTVFDEHMTDTAPYGQLLDWVDDPDYRMPGVDYPQLFEHLVVRDLSPRDLMWAYDLARVHAFVSLFT